MLGAPQEQAGAALPRGSGGKVPPELGLEAERREGGLAELVREMVEAVEMVEAGERAVAAVALAWRQGTTGIPQFLLHDQPILPCY